MKNAMNPKFVRKMLFLFFMVTLFPHAAFGWGALAIDGNNGNKYGWAVNYGTMEEAEKKALKECGDKCRVEMTFRNGAAAYVVDKTNGSTAFGWGRAETAGEAKERAISEATSRGASTPVVRVWGQDTTKNAGRASKESGGKTKVFVSLIMHVEDQYLPEGPKQSGPTFVGWTYAADRELMSYAQKRTGVVWAEKVVGSKRAATALLTNGKWGHKIENSPIIKRFISEVVEKSQFYSERANNEYVRNGVEVSWGNNDWEYDGDMFIIDGEWTYDTLKQASKLYSYAEEERKYHNGGWTVVDVGQF